MQFFYLWQNHAAVIGSGYECGEDKYIKDTFLLRRNKCFALTVKFSVHKSVPPPQMINSLANPKCVMDQVLVCKLTTTY